MKKLMKTLLGTLTAAMILSMPVSATVKLPDKQIQIMSESVDTDEMEQTSEELFAGYVDKEFGVQLFSDEAAVEKGTGYKKLTGANLTLYRQLRAEIAKIADGERTSTKIECDVDLEYTYEELGITDDDDDDEFSYKFFEAFYKDVSLKKIFNYLLVDCPYDLYWFDKVHSGAMSFDESFGENFQYTNDSIIIDSLIFTFWPAAAYAGEDDFTVDLTKTGATKAAVNNAKEIVDAATEKTDYEKIVYYKDQICELTSYNEDAMGAEYTGGYGDPWQIIYVFDKDPETNVVCEGYSKAFKYLCDKTSFDNKIETIIVDGNFGPRGKPGAHMWNITKMDNGRNYLVDVTNSDDGMVGMYGDLFLAGNEEGSPADGYTFEIEAESNHYTVDYKYSDSTLLSFTSRELTLAKNSYDVEKAGCSHEHTVIEGAAEPTCTEEGYTGDIVCTECDAILEEGNDIAKKAHEAKVVVPAVEPTCTQAGKTAEVHCAVCDVLISEQQDVAALGHDWDVVVTKEPSYTEEGIKTYTCNRCGETEEEIIPKKEMIKVTSIKLSGLSNKIAYGRKVQLTAKILPENANDKTVTWTTSNKKIATVSVKGLVTMNKKAGGKSVVITATAKDGSGVKGTYKITCMKGIVKSVRITGLKIVKAGKSIKLTAKVVATKGANKKVKWTSSNTKYATVSSSGKVTAKAAGKGKSVKITAMATDGSGKKATVTIKIK